FERWLPRKDTNTQTRKSTDNRPMIVTYRVDRILARRGRNTRSTRGKEMEMDFPFLCLLCFLCSVPFGLEYDPHTTGGAYEDYLSICISGVALRLQGFGSGPRRAGRAIVAGRKR